MKPAVDRNNVSIYSSNSTHIYHNVKSHILHVFVILCMCTCTVFTWIRNQLYGLCILLRPSHMQLICWYWRESFLLDVVETKQCDATQVERLNAFEKMKKKENKKENWNGYSKQIHCSMQYISSLYDIVLDFIYFF